MLEFIQKLLPAQTKNTSQQRAKSEARDNDVAFEDIRLKKKKRSFAHVHKGSCGFDICGLGCGCC